MSLDQFDNPPPAQLLVGRKWSFLGKELAPYSFGRRLIIRGVFSEKEFDPPNEVYTLSLIFALWLADDEAREALYHIPEHRKRLFAWIEALPVYAYAEAVRIANEILAEAKSGEVRVEPKAADLLQKKT